MNKYIFKFYRRNQTLCGSMPVWATSCTEALKCARTYSNLLLTGMMISIYESVNGIESPVADIKILEQKTA